MPLARYFVIVGGVLLALLFIADAFLPKFEVAERVTVNLPVIRIHSDRKWPERIVYDTSLPTIVPAQFQIREANVLAPTMPTHVSDTSKQREAFAQMRTSEPNRLQLSGPRKREQKSPGRSRIAKRRVAPPMVLVSRQTQFGWFGNSMW
jgi:hypothetical protein